MNPKKKTAKDTKPDPNPDIFYMVYCPARGAPTVQHRDILIAEAEAARIATLNKEPVFVLKAISKFEIVPNPVKKTEIN